MQLEFNRICTAKQLSQQVSVSVKIKEFQVISKWGKVEGDAWLRALMKSDLILMNLKISGHKNRNQKWTTGKKVITRVEGTKLNQYIFLK